MLVLPFPLSQLLGHGPFSVNVYIFLMRKIRKIEKSLWDQLCFDSTELEIILERYSGAQYMFAKGRKESRKEGRGR